MSAKPYLKYEIITMEEGYEVWYEITYKGDGIAYGMKYFGHKRSVKRGMERLGAALGITVVIEKDEN